MRTLLSRLKSGLSLVTGLFRRSSHDRRMDEEFRFHLEMETEANLRSGMSAKEAERAARVSFGGRSQVRAAAIDELRSRPVEELSNDLRNSLRALRRSPVFATVAIVTLGLGIGATTVFFSIADHVVLRPLPYPEPERLVIVRETIAEFADQLPELPANAGHFLEWRRRCSSCSQLGAIRLQPMTLTGTERPEQIGGARVSANLLPMLGARPILGRLFTDEEDRTGGPRVALIGETLWRSLGADPGIVDRPVTLDGSPWTVIGVLPREFQFPRGHELGIPWSTGTEVEIFVPLSLTQFEITTPGDFGYAVIAQLAPGRRPEATAAELNQVAGDLTRQAGGRVTFGARIVPLRQQVVGSAATSLLLLLAAVGAVLVIVAMNLANLLLARNVARSRESAVRLAIGAPRSRVVRQALTETLTLALIGGSLGILIAHFGLGALLAIAPADLPRLDEISLDGRVLTVALGLSLAVGLAFGALPALRSSRIDPADVLKSGGRTTGDPRSGKRGPALLIATQVALSAVLLAATGLFLSSFVKVMNLRMGFEVGPVLAMDLNLPLDGFGEREKRAPVLDAILERLANTPGVRAAAVTNAIPLEGDTQVDGLARENDPRPEGERPIANIRYVSPDYFAVIGTPLLKGRTFTDADRDRPVVVISEEAAANLWPGEEPIGKRMTPGSNDQLSEVVGVVADISTGSPERGTSLAAYLPHRGMLSGTATLLIRADRNPERLTASIRGELATIAPTAPISRIRTLPEVLSRATASRRFQLLVLMVFAATAVVTAAVGIYGVIAYSLGRRQTEIGIRMALGATRSEVHRQVLREGLTPVAIGLAAGIAIAVTAGRLVSNLLFEVAPADPLTMAGVTVLLLLVATVACWIPARRATVRPPLLALRSE